MTIFGAPSIAELQDFVETKQYTVKQLTDAYLSFKDSWIAKNKNQHDDWIFDWRAFVARYEPAIRNAKIKIAAAGALVGVSNTLIPATDAYEEIRKALTRKNDGSYSKGDIQDLHNRLSEARGKDVRYDNQPQPKIDNDADKNIYNASNVAIKSVESVAKDVSKSPYTYVIAGMVGLGILVVLKR
jgi:hypothetical protein